MIEHHEVYRAWTDAYDLLVAREDFKGLLMPALHRIRDMTGQDIIELGAGTGRLTCMIAPIARTIAACDHAAPMLKVAVRKLERLQKANWRIILADNEHIPFHDGVADTIISGWSLNYLVMWHWERWKQMVDQSLEQMKRTLRSGGFIVILETMGTGRETPEPPDSRLEAYYEHLERAWGFQATWVRTDYRFLNREEADRTVRFFFGDRLADQLKQQDPIVLPECTGIWWLQL